MCFSKSVRCLFTRHLRASRNFLAGSFFLLSLSFADAADKGKWTAVSPADLAATSSQAAPGSDLEVLLNHQVLDSDNSTTWIAHHIQAKIYSEKGVEQSTIFAIEYDKNYKIWDIAARIVKPDGSSVELTKKDFRETSVFKVNGYEAKRTAFAFPNVRPGDVLEYRWNQSVPDGFYNYLTTYCQHVGAPTREYLFEVISARTDFNVSWFNCPSVERKAGGKQIIVRNLPPFNEEPLMPPQTEFRSWILLVFSHPFLRFYDNQSAWENLGEYLAEDFRLTTKPSSALKAKATELLAGASSPDEKLARLYDFCQTEIRNFNWTDKSKVLDAKKRRDNEDSEQSPAKTMDRKTGYPIDIDVLFAALARAAGFETRLALSADRDETLNINTARGWILANRRSVAVKIGEHWKFYVPGQYLVPAGLLSPHDQGAMMFVCDEKKSWFDTAQTAQPDASPTHRTGHFTLDSEGTLDGTVEIRFTGQRALAAKERWRDESSNDVINAIRDGVVNRLAAAEVTDVAFENVAGRDVPVILRYHVRVPGYAEQLGSRLAFPVNFFKAGTLETFTADLRHYPIFFEYPEQEHDELELALPAGFMLDGPSSPPPVGPPGDTINAQYGMKYLPKSHKLEYSRDYTIGNHGAIAFRTESYAPLRQLLGKIHRSDTHQLVLKPRPEAAASADTAAAKPATTSP